MTIYLWNKDTISYTTNAFRKQTKKLLEVKNDSRNEKVG
jgi:hypothetical protein